MFLRRDVRYSGISFPPKYDDLECVAVDLFLGRKVCRLCCVYRPPDTSVENSKFLCEWIELNCSKSTPCIVVGDFNLPLFDWSDLSNVPRSETYTLFRDCFLQCDLSQYITEATFGDNILDLLFCTDENIICEKTVCCGFSTSNHSSLMFQLMSSFPPKEGSCRFRDYRKTDFENFEMYLSVVLFVLFCYLSVGLMSSLHIHPLRISGEFSVIF